MMGNCRVATQLVSSPVVLSPIELVIFIRYIEDKGYKCIYDRLCGLVVRVFGYRSGGPGSIPGTTKKKK
jgi:hypothetical protein